jgi:hypothetical protein
MSKFDLTVILWLPLSGLDVGEGSVYQEMNVK